MEHPLQLPLTLPSNLRSISLIDLRGKLPVNPKYTWEQLAGLRKIEDLNIIVFHHDAWPKSVSAKYTDIELARRIALDHIESTKNKPEGDAGFPYDLWIRNGIIYVCNDLLPKKFGVSNNNLHTVHICVSGDYANYDGLTDADRNAMLAAYALYKDAMPAYKAVKGHRELNPSKCPGYDMNRVRAEIAELELMRSVTNTTNDNLAKVFQLRTRFEDIYNRAINPKDPYNAEAIRKMLEAYEMWIDRGVL